MRTVILLAAIVIAAGGAGFVLQGPVPGDVAVTAGLQAMLGAGNGWAGWLTATAKAPILWGTIALAGWLAWRAAGWRATLATVLAYAFAFGADKALRAALFVPRPDPALVTVAEPAASSGMPSTFGLVYGAIFGVVLLAKGAARRTRLLRITAGALLVVGAAARIVSGGHWPSQMVASIAFGLLLALAALAITRRLRFRRA
jgi:membrane-associated phospholipid phosphatase